MRYHHSHIPLHHAHHALHCRRICHRVRGRFAPVLRVLEESPIFVRGDEVSFAGGEGGGRYGGGVAAEVNAAEEGALFAKRGEGKLLWGGLEEDCKVMAENTGEDLRSGQMMTEMKESPCMGSDHDYGDGKEDPIATMTLLSAWLPRRMSTITRELDPCEWSEPLSPPSSSNCGDSIKLLTPGFEFTHSPELSGRAGLPARVGDTITSAVS